MAGINGLKSLFNGRQMQNIFSQFQERADEKAILTLQYLGEQFVNNARLSGNYTDRTGNLRSSIGYIILKDGVTVDKNFEGKAKGKSKAKSVSSEVASQYPKGLVLIGVAGMEYAAYVEAKGFDVITSSVPSSNDLKSFFNEI